MFFEKLFLYNEIGTGVRKKRNKYNGGFAMQEKNLLKVCEILAGRVLELENDLKVSQFRIDKLREIVEKAESEAGQ